MATDLICGTGGSTGAEVIQRINELSHLDPRATAHLLTPIAVDLDDTTTEKLPVFDDAKTERAGFEVNLNEYQLVNNSGQDFFSVLVSVGLNVRFPSTEQLDLWVYLNDQPYSTSEFTIRGQGTNKPTAVFWQSDVTLQDGDHIDLRAKNAASGSVTVTFERVQFRIDADYKENIA